MKQAYVQVKNVTQHSQSLAINNLIKMYASVRRTKENCELLQRHGKVTQKVVIKDLITSYENELDILNRAVKGLTGYEIKELDRMVLAANEKEGRVN